MDAHDQEKAFEKLLARTLRQSLEPGGAECPGPDILAGYLDRSLGDAEASHWELHFSECARCQQVLAEIDVSAAPLPAAETQVPAIEISDLRAVAAPAAEPVETRPAASTISRGPKGDIGTRRRYLSWRWLVPAAGVAAAVALWIAIRPAPHRAPGLVAVQPSVEGPKEVAQNNPPPALATRIPEITETQPQPAAQAPAARSRAAKAGPEPASAKRAMPGVQPSAAPGRAEQEAKALSAGTGAQGAAPLAESRAAVVAQKEGPEQLAMQPKEADQAAAAPAKPSESPRIAEIPKKTEMSKTAEARPGLAAAVAPAAPAAAKQREEETPKTFDRRLRTAALAQPSTAVIPSPDLSALWRVGPAGTIARSHDAGRTWQAQVSNVAADLLAGSAPSETVCWVVGRAGIILRTTDGEQWEKIPSPAPVDWIGVKARDALNATVVAASQQRYVTKDGGKRWRGPLPH